MPVPRGRFIGLLALATVLPTLEGAVFNALDFRSAEGLAPQSSALWPYDSYHDLRWLLVYHNSWQTFLLGFAGMVILRGLISAGLVRLAWPGSTPCPAFRRLLGRNLAVAAGTAVIISPLAALAVAASVVSLSWFVFASVLPMLLLSPFLQRIGVGAGWWRGLPSAALVGWSLLDFVVITVAGALVWRAPDYWTLVVAAACGIGNGLLWKQTVRAAVNPAHVHWRRVPVAPMAIVLALLIPLLVQSMTVVGAPSRNNFRPPVLTHPLPATVPYAVLVLAGHNSTYDGQPALDPAVRQFSYAGLDPDGRARPYSLRDTHRSLDSSAALLATQVNDLNRRTGRPVALMAESEGAMVSVTYLRDTPGSPVKALLMFSPLVRTGRAYYPPPSASSGWGLVAGWELRGIFGAVNLMTGGHDSADEPFVRSLLENAPFYRYQTLCPVPGVRVVAFLPTVSAAETPPGPYTNIPTFVTPGLHGGLLGRPAIHDRADDFLAGAKVAAPRGEYGIIQVLAGAWQAPSLAITVNPVWRPQVSPGPPFSAKRICAGR
ncbi:hypothetical protein ACFFWC_03955 [Plantactinospora siamensis]|uniref:Alpha/beta hydrolase n=1 Tax=Plantactinospora siamensis TaxID=555372 RepID=A0ABV6NST4_9ACTN